jgi:hypothetical protein
VFSASSETRDRNAPTNAHQIRLQTSRIRQEHRPIRYQLPARLNFRQGQAPDIFEIVLKKLGMEGSDAVAIGDSPYDAEAAGKAKIATIGVLCGGFTEASLREAGCVEVYPGPAALFARFEHSLLRR